MGVMKTLKPIRKPIWNLNPKPKPSGQSDRLKVIVTNHIIEVYEYEIPVTVGGESKGGRKAGELGTEYRAISGKRARDKIRRLACANFDTGSKFVTLTFADNVTDVKLANQHFKKFIQRMRYKYKGFKYIAVIEFQQRGAVHYHLMMDLPYVDKAALQEIWGHGFVKINKINHVDNVGAYLVKYLAKDLEDTRLCGLKAYLTSKNLTQPTVMRLDQADIVAQTMNQKKEVFKTHYVSEYQGKITYRQYNLLRDDSVTQ